MSTPGIWCRIKFWLIWHTLQVCSFKNKKKYTNFSGKLGVLFDPKTTFLVISPTFSMLNLKKHQIWVSWVITKILICHMPGLVLERKFFLLFLNGCILHPYLGVQWENISINFPNFAFLVISNCQTNKIITKINIFVTMKIPYVHLVPQCKIKDMDNIKY